MQRLQITDPHWMPKEMGEEKGLDRAVGRNKRRKRRSADELELRGGREGNFCRWKQRGSKYERGRQAEEGVIAGRHTICKENFKEKNVDLKVINFLV